LEGREDGDGNTEGDIRSYSVKNEGKNSHWSDQEFFQKGMQFA
jgi:hypothetical protein